MKSAMNYKLLILLIVMMLGGTWFIAAPAQSNNSRNSSDVKRAVSPPLPAQSNNSTDHSDIERAFGPPLMFIENVGQFADEARFQVWGGRNTMWLAKDALWITVLESEGSDRLDVARADDSRMQSPESQSTKSGVNLKVSFIGATADPIIEPFNRLDTTVNYFRGNDPDKWRSNVPVWGGVRYKDIYPGIDLEVTSEAGEYIQRLVAHADADLSAVRWRVHGAGGVEIISSSASGGEGLRLTTAIGHLTLPWLHVVASDGTPLDLAYEPVVTGNTGNTGNEINEIRTPFFAHSRLQMDSMDSTDSTDLGSLNVKPFVRSSELDVASVLAWDKQLYLMGSTYFADFSATAGVYESRHNHNQERDLFVLAMPALGTSSRTYTFVGGDGNDVGEALARSDAGEMVVRGRTESQDFPTTANGHDHAPSNNFLFALSPDGTSLRLSTFVGHRDSDVDEALALSGVVISGTWSLSSTAGVLDSRKQHDSKSTVPPSNAFVENSRTSAPEGSQTITHSTSQDITQFNWIEMCLNPDPLFSWENSYYRVFDLANDFGINNEFNITSVQFGVDLAVGAGGDQPLTVNLYTLSGSFELANLTLISTFEGLLSDTALNVVRAPIEGTVPAGATLVVEVFAPNGQDEENVFLIGSNAEGQTGPSYWRAPECGRDEPTDLAQIGFEDVHFVMNVIGEAEQGPTPTPTRTPTRIPTRTSVAATRTPTRTPVAATRTPTRTPVAATRTPVAATRTRTPTPVAATPTRTPTPVAATPTRTPTVAPTRTPMPTATPTNAPPPPGSISHSTSQNITSGNSAQCGPQESDVHSENSYYRVFDLADFGINNQFNVSTVEFGVESARGAGGNQPVTVNLYTLSGSFTLANLTRIGSADLNLPNQALSLATVSVEGTVPASGTLVVEVLTPDGRDEENIFFIGSNAQGQTGPSYFRGPNCGMNQPTDLAEIGFEDMHIVMNVIGREIEPPPTPTPTNAPPPPGSISHSASQEISRNSINCGPQESDVHSENSYYRVFDLADFGINKQFNVNMVEFGVQRATGAGGNQPVTVNLYTLSGSFTLANLTRIGSADLNLPDQALSIATVSVEGTVPASGTLVVEVLTPDGEDEENIFFIGSNAQGQTGPSYLRAPDCGIDEPTDLAQMGFEDMQIVMNVIGSAGSTPGVTPSPTPTSESAILRTGDYHVASNGQFTMKVEAANVPSPGLSAANISLSYDNTVIEPKSCTIDSAFTGTCNTAVSGEVRFNILSTSGVQGEFDLVEIVFDAVGQENDTSTLDLNTSVFADSGGTSIPVTLSDGSVTLAQALGDVSCDNQVNVLDALFILQFDVGTRRASNQCPLADNTLLLANCDVNSDNACNSIDALFVLQCDVGVSNVLCPTRSPSTPSDQPTEAAGSATVEIGTHQVEASSTVTVPVNANTSNTALGAATIQVKFDPNVVQVTTCEVISPLFGECNSDNQNGVISFNALSTSGTTGDFTLANITFEGGSSGTTALDVDIRTFADTSGNNITVSDVDGQINIASSENSHQLFLPLLLR